MKRSKLERFCGELGIAVTKATDRLLRDKKTIALACEIIERLHEIDPMWRDTCCGFEINNPSKKK